MTLDDEVHAFRLHILRRADTLGNVSAACREAGISRTLFYRWRKRFLRYGSDGLHPRQTGERRGRPPQLSPAEEWKAVATALVNPSWGPQRMALQFAQEGFYVSSTPRLGRQDADGLRIEFCDGSKLVQYGEPASEMHFPWHISGSSPLRPSGVRALSLGRLGGWGSRNF